MDCSRRVLVISRKFEFESVKGLKEQADKSPKKKKEAKIKDGL